MDKCTNVLMDIWMDRQTAIPTLHVPDIRACMCISECKKIFIFKANVLHLKVLEILLENLKTVLGMKPYQIHTQQAWGHDLTKITNTCHL